MDKIKVALICHFSNPLVRDHLQLQSKESGCFSDFGGWITNIVNGLKSFDDIELHVVAPHRGMKKTTQEFETGGVTYHFYRPYLPNPWGYWEDHLRIQELTSYRRCRNHIRDFINIIKPDLVNLIGAENPYYSIGALDIEGIPIILHCQTVYANPDRKKNAGNVNMFRWKTEIKLFHKIPYIACAGRMYYDLIKGYEPKAIFFPRTWPKSPFPSITDVGKNYDFAYWARYLNRNKGFDNAIEAIGVAARKHPEIKFLAVGTWDGDRALFEQRIRELGIEDNIEIHPSFPRYTEMLQYVKQAKYALLPIKMDVLSETLLEAMRMGMPVITNRTSGTPSLNEKRETVLISDIGDNEGLACNVVKLYEDAELAKKLAKNAGQYISETDERDSHNVETMIAQYKAVLAHYHYGVQIPQELLYDTDKNIDYRRQ